MKYKKSFVNRVLSEFDYWNSAKKYNLEDILNEMCELKLNYINCHGVEVNKSFSGKERVLEIINWISQKNDLELKSVRSKKFANSMNIFFEVLEDNKTYTLSFVTDGEQIQSIDFL